MLRLKTMILFSTEREKQKQNVTGKRNKARSSSAPQNTACRNPQEWITHHLGIKVEKTAQIKTMLAFHSVANIYQAEGTANDNA